MILPMRELFEKRGGIWRLETKMMLPGYLFAEIPDGADTAAYWHGIRRTDGVLRILGGMTGGDLKRLEILSNHGRAWGISCARRPRRILAGPLLGREDWIEAIDWHRRRAYIRLRVDDVEHRISLGIIEQDALEAAQGTPVQR